MKMICVLVLAWAAVVVMPAYAQTNQAGGKTPDTMQILRDKLKADKKLVVAANMDLTEAEAKVFWPIYDEYQKALHQINDRMAMIIVAYAKEHNAASMTDDKASALMDRYMGIEEEELKLKRSFAPRLAKVLPGRKAARYMQIENKIRALVKYELAGEVPLVR